MPLFSLPVRHLSTLGVCAGVLFSPLNWQTELHTDLSSWLEVDDTKSVEIADSITRESVFHPPSEHSAVRSCHCEEAETGASTCRRSS